MITELRLLVALTRPELLALLWSWETAWLVAEGLHPSASPLLPSEQPIHAAP